MTDNWDADAELARDILELKTQFNPETGKPYGLRLIAEMLGETYGRIRYVDDKYNVVPDEYHVPVGLNTVEIQPIRTFTWDLETTALDTFFGHLIVASFLDMADGQIYTRSVNDFEGNATEKEAQLLMWTLDMLEYGDVFIGHNTIGFDLGFLRGRLALHGIDRDIKPRQHWDTYQIAKNGFKGRPQGYSLENLLDFFRVPVQKDKPSKHDWAGSVVLDEDAIDRITIRCEADVVGNALLWPHLRTAQHKWRGR